MENTSRKKNEPEETASTRANPGFYEAHKLNFLFLPIRRRIKKQKNKKTKQKTRQQHVLYVRVIRVHIHIHICSTYIMIQLQHYAVLLHVVGTKEVEIQYYRYTAVCVRKYACARTRCI